LFLVAIKELRSKGFSPVSLRHFLLNQKGESNDWPEDAEFQACFHRRPLYRDLPPGRLTYILRKLEAAERSKFSESVTINSDLSLEHILPRAWAETWSLKNGQFANSEQIEWTRKQVMLQLPLDVLSKEIARREEAVDTLGNLTLIVGRLNSSISNRPFAEKRGAILQHSALRLNRYFHSVEGWDESAIAARSVTLFGDAQMLWPRPAGG